MVIQLVVRHNNDTFSYFKAEVWKIDPTFNCLVIGKGLPRKYVPLCNVKDWDVEEAQK